VALLDSGEGWRDGLEWYGSRGERLLTTPLRLGAQSEIASEIFSHYYQAPLYSLLTFTLLELDAEVDRGGSSKLIMVNGGPVLTLIRLAAPKSKIGLRFRWSDSAIIIAWSRMTSS